MSKHPKLLVFGFVGLVVASLLGVVFLSSLAQQSQAPESSHAAPTPALALALASAAKPTYKAGDVIVMNVVAHPTGVITLQPAVPAAGSLPTYTANATTTGKKSCGESCKTDSDCKPKGGNGGPEGCRNNVCVNLACSGATTPGGNCDCAVTNRTCGQTCGASVGLCGDGSVCTFISGVSCTGNEFNAATVCVPRNKLPAGWTVAKCSTGGNSYVSIPPMRVYGAGGIAQVASTNPTIAQIQSLCGQSPLVTPQPIAATVIVTFDPKVFTKPVFAAADGVVMSAPTGASVQVIINGRANTVFTSAAKTAFVDGQIIGTLQLTVLAPAKTSTIVVDKSSSLGVPNEYTGGGQLVINMAATCPVVNVPNCPLGQKAVASGVVDANGCPGPMTCGTPTPPPTPGTCQTLWFFDKGENSKACTQKQFCGSYMYAGLQTFATQAECQAALTPSPTPAPACHSYWFFDTGANSKSCTQKQFCGVYMYQGLQTFDTQTACQTALGSH